MWFHTLIEFVPIFAICPATLLYVYQNFVMFPPKYNSYYKKNHAKMCEHETSNTSKLIADSLLADRVVEEIKTIICNYSSLQMKC